MRIEEAAAKKQANIDTEQEYIVGVNIFQTDDTTDFEILEIDNTQVRNQQIEKLNSIKQSRNNDAVQVALDKITAAAKNGTENLLTLAVDAARQRATLGEISLALEKVFGRYNATIKTISGVYANQSKQNKDFES